jgi:CheY-like chemotaxis protein
MEWLERGGGEAWDIVITDVQMPEMDGYELARRIAVLHPDLPVIGLTAHAMTEERGRCLGAGMVEYLAKPVDIDRLVSIVARCARRHSRPMSGGDGHRPMLDRRRLEARYGDRTAFIATLMATVRRAHANTAAELRAAARDGDVPRLAMLAHTVKGTAGNLGGGELQDVARRAEAAARAGDGEAVAQALALAAAVETLLVELAPVELAENTL